MLIGGGVTAASSAPFTSSAAGDVPASGGGTANFLRADATFAQPIPTFTVSTPTRSLDSTFAPSATLYTLCIYSVQIACTAGQDGNVELRSDAASPPTVARSSMRALVSGLINDVGTHRVVLMYLCPPGHNVRLVTGGTGTFTLSTQTEITIG